MNNAVMAEKGEKFSFTRGWNPAIIIERYKNASVVQWIERQIPVLKVGGSSPFGRAKKVLQFIIELRDFFVFKWNLVKKDEVRA